MLRNNITLKDESLNPYGTWKDRRSKYILRNAQKENVSKLCLITSGNAGYSIAKFAVPKGIKVVSIIDKKTKQHIKDSLSIFCTRVIEVDLSEKLFKPEEIISLARENEEESIWDITNGWSIAYESMADEIKNENFDYVICPVGSGEAFVGIYQGIKRNGMSTKLVGVGVLECPSFADKLATPYTPYESKIDQILEEGHILVRLTEKEVRKAYDLYGDKYNSEPSATVVWEGLEKTNIESDKKILVINSGKGFF